MMRRLIVFALTLLLVFTSLPTSIYPLQAQDGEPRQETFTSIVLGQDVTLVCDNPLLTCGGINVAEMEVILTSIDIRHLQSPVKFEIGPHDGRSVAQLRADGDLDDFIWIHSSSTDGPAILLEQTRYVDGAVMIRVRISNVLIDGSPGPSYFATDVFQIALLYGLYLHEKRLTTDDISFIDFYRQYPALQQNDISAIIIDVAHQDEEEFLFSRTVEISMVRVINAVNVRRGAGTGYEAIRQAQAGEEFAVRDGVEPEASDGYTWISVVVDDEDAWIAQEGFLEMLTTTEQVPVSPEEVELAYAAALPEGAVEVVVQDNQLQAVDMDGQFVAVWDWGIEPYLGQWRFSGPYTAEVNGHTATIIAEYGYEHPETQPAYFDAVEFADYLDYLGIHPTQDFEVLIIDQDDPRALGFDNWILEVRDNMGVARQEVGQDGAQILTLQIIIHPHSYTESGGNRINRVGDFVFGKGVQLGIAFNLWKKYKNSSTTWDQFTTMIEDRGRKPHFLVFQGELEAEHTP